MFKHRKVFWAIWLLLALTVSGCSSTRIGYRLLDDFARWKIDEYVVLDDQQGRDLDLALDDFLAWHRREQLPAYIRFLDQQSALLEQPQISPTQLGSSADKVLKLARDSTNRLVQNIVRLLPTLNDEQVAEFLKNYDKKARTYEKDRILPKRTVRHKERIQRMRKFLGKWTGRLTEQQVARITQWADQLSYETSARLDQRRRFRSSLARTLATRQQPDKLRNRLERVMVYPERQYTSAYRKYSDYNRQQTLQLLADIHASLTTEQKRRLLQKLKRYRGDFLVLSGQPGKMERI